MCFSVAQLAVCVFMLDTPMTMSEVSPACTIWDQRRDPLSPVDNAFQEWAVARGQPMLRFYRRGAALRLWESLTGVKLILPGMAQTLIRVLRSMLRLPPPPAVGSSSGRDRRRVNRTFPRGRRSRWLGRALVGKKWALGNGFRHWTAGVGRKVLRLGMNLMSWKADPSESSLAESSAGKEEGLEAGYEFGELEDLNRVGWGLKENRSSWALDDSPASGDGYGSRVRWAAGPVGPDTGSESEAGSRVAAGSISGRRYPGKDEVLYTLPPPSENRSLRLPASGLARLDSPPDDAALAASSSHRADRKRDGPAGSCGVGVGPGAAVSRRRRGRTTKFKTRRQAAVKESAAGRQTEVRASAAIRQATVRTLARAEMLASAELDKAKMEG